jgi:hypothetical protein
MVGQDSLSRTARTGKPGSKNRDKTAGVDNRDSAVRIGTEDRTTRNETRIGQRNHGRIVRMGNL